MKTVRRIGIVAASLFLCCATASPARAQTGETRAIARAARGSVGSIEVAYRDAPLRAKALRDADAPVLVRVTTLGADRYRIDYIGAVTGTYDLLPAIERADGRAPEGLGSLSVEIFSQLPPNAGTDVFGLSAPGFNFSAHYAAALWTLGALWAAVPTLFLLRRAMRRTPTAAPVAPPREPTTAELLFAAVDAARARELTADERGQLELRLLQILRRGSPEGDVAAAITALRADPRTGAVVRAVESWLHAPEGGDASRALAEIDALRAKPAGSAAPSTTGGAP
jgi:hypothetical protein